MKYHVKYQNISISRFYFPHVILNFLGIIRLDFWKAPLQLEGKHYKGIDSSSTNNHYNLE